MSVPPFNPDADPSAYLYEAMAAHLEARINAGDLLPGARLPNERDLAWPRTAGRVARGF